jgi:hypothetical protein
VHASLFYIPILVYILMTAFFCSLSAFYKLVITPVHLRNHQAGASYFCLGPLHFVFANAITYVLYGFYVISYPSFPLYC